MAIINEKENCEYILHTHEGDSKTLPTTSGVCFDEFAECNYESGLYQFIILMILHLYFQLFFLMTFPSKNRSIYVSLLMEPFVECLFENIAYPIRIMDVVVNVWHREHNRIEDVVLET